MDVIRYWQALRRWWWLIAAGLVLALATSLVTSKLTAR